VPEKEAERELKKPVISKYPFEKRTFLKDGGGRRIDGNEYLKT